MKEKKETPLTKINDELHELIAELRYRLREHYIPINTANAIADEFGREFKKLFEKLKKIKLRN